MSDLREDFAREIRHELAEFNDPEEPVVFLVREVAEMARRYARITAAETGRAE